MNPFQSDLKIELLVTSYNSIGEVIKVFRTHSNQTVSAQSRSIKNKEVVYSVVLVKTDFYAEWKALFELACELHESNIGFELRVNSKVADSNFLKDLKAIVTSIKREDIY